MGFSIGNVREEENDLISAFHRQTVSSDLKECFFESKKYRISVVANFAYKLGI